MVAGEVVVKAHASPDASTRRCGRGSAANKRHACICARDPSPPFPPPLPRARECSRSIFCPGAAPSQVAAERQSACLHFQVRTHTHTHMLTHTTNANKHTHTKTYARHMHTHRCTHVHTHTHADAHTCAYTHPRTHPPPKKYTQTHTHTHAHERAHTTHQSVQKPDMSAPAAQQLLGALQHQAPPPLAATPLHQLAAVALGCPLRRSCPAPRWPCTQQWLLCALCQHAVATALALPPQLIAAQ